MKKIKTTLRRTCASLLVLCALGACAGKPDGEGRKATTYEIASAAHLTPFVFKTQPFALLSFLKINTPGAPITVYIEGDGLAWRNRHTPSNDPTPVNPLALRLAALDSGANVVWLARPCQYTGLADCQMEYWTSARFAPEVIQSYAQVLEDLKTRYKTTAFDLVGFSGGGAVAALAAAGRGDISSLRTVAGNLDHVLLNQIHRVSPMQKSLNPRDAAAKLGTVPQIHFTGEQDKTVPVLISQSFLKAAGGSSCIKIQTIPGASHEDGWVRAWPDLSKTPATCE